MILNSEAISDESKNKFADDILDVAFNKDKKAEKFIKQSPFLLKNNGYTSVGKYKNWFWISSEGIVHRINTSLNLNNYRTIPLSFSHLHHSDMEHSFPAKI